MGKKKQLMKSEQQSDRIAALDIAELDFAMKFSEVMAEGDATIPKHLQGKRADCLAIYLQAKSWGMSPYAVAQGTSLINGTLAYSAQLVNAVVTRSGLICGSFHYEFSGPWKSDKDPDAWVKCGAQLAGDAQITWGEPLYPATVTTKNSPLWKTAPKQQASYLAVKYWSRLYTPGAILGVMTRDEVAQQQERDVTPAAAPVSALRIPEEPAKKFSFSDVEACIHAASTTAKLKAAGVMSNNADINDTQRETLRTLWTSKMDSLKSKKDVTNAEV
jgi:hypothetical protein